MENWKRSHFFLLLLNQETVNAETFAKFLRKLS